MSSLIKNQKIFVEDLLVLERSGNYEDAILKLGDIWTDTSNFPNLDDFDTSIAAEITLRCGSLIGFFGHMNQVENAQEHSRNLLSESRNKFLDMQNYEKVAECENYLALAYWRTGELVEARTWIEESLARDIHISKFAKLFAYIIESKIDFAEKQFTTICEKFDFIRQDFLGNADDSLKGDFFNQYGLAMRNLGNVREALEKYELARHFHERAGHKIYLAAVENNLAFVYQKEGRFVDAQSAIDNAIRLFRELNDLNREGFSLDTKAQIFFDEGRFIDALKTVEVALTVLERGENAGFLVETYFTKAKILLALGDLSSAMFSLFDAVQIAKSKISESSAENLVKEFEIELLKRRSSSVSIMFSEKEMVSGDLELFLPPSISHYSRYQAVRIKNTHLEKIGLTQNTLAIVVDSAVNRGDLAAVSQIEDGSIICGYFDSDFGIICLEGIDSEPILLDENSVKILGKIVGFSDGEKDSNGKLIVKAL